jgi:hypothetical protein
MQSTAMLVDSAAYCVANEPRFKKESTTPRPGSFEVRSERIPASAEVSVGTTGGWRTGVNLYLNCSFGQVGSLERKV